MAAKVKKAVHHVCELNERNFLAKRLEGIWWTDGHLDLMNMHGVEFLDRMKENYDFNLDGFAGDLILGASYVPVNKPFGGLSKENIADLMGCEPYLLWNFDYFRIILLTC